jgi:hypothetical protein
VPLYSRLPRPCARALPPPPCAVHQLPQIPERFEGRVFEPSVAPGAFVRSRPDGQKLTKEEDDADDAAYAAVAGGGEASAGGAGAAAGSSG